jgi:NADH dehydrogenase
MKRRILIVGGGYAGTLCANRLARKASAASTEIVLADPRPWFVDRIRLHEEVAGGEPRRRARASMVDGARVRLRIGGVVELDVIGRRAIFDDAGAAGDARAEAFDEVVVATGSVGPTGGIAGIHRAWSCATVERAVALRARLDTASGGRVVIVGGGLTGIELASELAERRKDLRVTLVASTLVGTALSEGGRAYVRSTLEKLGVVLREGVSVVAVEDDAVVLESGDAIPSDVTVWCGGFEAAPLAARSGLAVDDLGRALVDARLRSTSHDFVRVIGDAAHLAWPRRDGVVTPMRMGCVSAMPMAAYCADDIARAGGQGSDRGAFAFGYLIQCISLGRRAGIVQHVGAYDVAKPRHLGGWLGAWGKELICRYAFASLGLERRGVGYAWPRPPALPAPPASPMLASRET